ncbi:MAG: response regulator [Deltaproteobacteria bacterium]|nr:response regulator [Deltaproteobacteria bacterium]
MPKKITILEDDEATAELIKFYLQEEGLHVAISTKGGGFVDKVVEYQPDLITLDIVLPDTDGFSVFKKLQEDERTRDIPVVFVSVKEGARDKGLKMGARGYVVKPFKEDELKGVIKSVLE